MDDWRFPRAFFVPVKQGHDCKNVQPAASLSPGGLIQEGLYQGEMKLLFDFGGLEFSLVFCYLFLDADGDLKTHLQRMHVCPVFGVFHGNVCFTDQPAALKTGGSRSDG